MSHDRSQIDSLNHMERGVVNLMWLTLVRPYVIRAYEEDIQSLYVVHYPRLRVRVRVAAASNTSIRRTGLTSSVTGRSRVSLLKPLPPLSTTLHHS
jgi:hypothetical protein